MSQNYCPKTTVPRPLSQDHCSKSAVPRPLSQDYCPKATVPRPKSQDCVVPRLLWPKTAPRLHRPKTVPRLHCPKAVPRLYCSKTVARLQWPKTSSVLSQDLSPSVWIVGSLLLRCGDSWTTVPCTTTWALVKIFPKIPILMAKIQILTPLYFISLSLFQAIWNPNFFAGILWSPVRSNTKNKFSQKRKILNRENYKNREMNPPKIQSWQMSTFVRKMSMSAPPYRSDQGTYLNSMLNLDIPFL